VISGHSHGGALAELNAIDAINHWKCDGRDLEAKDIAVILAAPHASLLPLKAINDVISCTDDSRCLAGRIATLVTDKDPVGGGYFGAASAGAPKHPSTVSRLPCPEPPAGKSFASEAEKLWWCHDISNYLPMEQVLVDAARWGSSCSGACGHPNKMMQCVQYIEQQEKGCYTAPSNASEKLVTCGPEQWRPDQEVCDCKLMSITELEL